MKKIILILLSIISITSFSQTSFQCTKTIDTSNCKLRFFNANSVKIFELNLATTTYTRGVTNEYIIKDGITQVTIQNNACLTTPTFYSLASFIDGARIACNSNSGSSVTFSSNLDTTQVDTSLINYLVQFDTTINRLDSILASIKRQSSIDTTHTAILQSIQDSINSKLSIIDKSDIDTSLVQVIQLNQIIDSLSTLINKSNLDTTHTAIFNVIKDLISKLDTSSIDTSLVPMVNYTELFYALINKGYDTSQVDTALDKHILLDSTLVRILNDTINVRFFDSTYYTQLDSIKYFLSKNDSIEVCFDTITFNSYVVNLPTTICNGDSAVRVQICNVDSSFNQIFRDKIDTVNSILRQEIDTTNAILKRIELNTSTTNLDTTHEAILQKIENNTKIECSGLNRRYYIDGTNTITINSSTVCSYSITVLKDAIQITEDGITAPFQFNTGYTTSNSNFGKLLNNSIMITGVTAGTQAVITTIE